MTLTIKSAWNENSPYLFPKCRLRPLHTESEIIMCFSVFSYCPSFPIKFMQQMRKRRKSNLIRFFFDGRTFRRQCANVIDNARSYLFFNVRKFRTQCVETFTVNNSSVQVFHFFKKKIICSSASTFECNTNISKMHRIKSTPYIFSFNKFILI